MGAHWPLIVSTSGRFDRVHDGDVKIYENLDCLPRAYVVYQARVVPDDETALAALADPAFNPATEVLLTANTSLSLSLSLSLSPSPPSTAQILAYEPERVVISTTLAAPGYLVLSDTWYPGWQATVDGADVPIERANLMLRAVAVPAGAHRVEFTYWPTHWGAGWSISGGTLGIVVLGLVAAAGRAVVRRTRGDTSRASTRHGEP